MLSRRPFPALFCAAPALFLCVLFLGAPSAKAQTVTATPSPAPAAAAPAAKVAPTAPTAVAPPSAALPSEQQRLEVCTPMGLSRDSDGLSPEQRKELATMCITYFYGAFLCAPVKVVLEAVATYGKQYQLDEKSIDPVAFAAPGSWLNHIKANALQAKQIGQAGVQARMNAWSQLASAYFTQTFNSGKRMTGPILLAYIRGPEFAQICPHVKP